MRTVSPEFNTYDEYGKPASTNLGRFQYTGQIWMAELELHDYKARMRHPDLPVFLQLDPIWPADGPNGYGYAGGDPINGTDPSGLQTGFGGRGAGPNPHVRPEEQAIIVIGRRLVRDLVERAAGFAASLDLARIFSPASTSTGNGGTRGQAP